MRKELTKSSVFGSDPVPRSRPVRLRTLARLCWLLNCEWQLLGLGAPVLELRAHALAGGTVLDVHKSPQVRGFIVAAGVLPAGIFLV
jgi:hypothetical protein